MSEDLVATCWPPHDKFQAVSEAVNNNNKKRKEKKNLREQDSQRPVISSNVAVNLRVALCGKYEEGSTRSGATLAGTIKGVVIG